MINILSEDLSESEIEHVLKCRRGASVLAGIRRLNGDSIPVLRDAILCQADEEAGSPMPLLTDELYGIFHQTGDRLTFERVYFERRRRLGRAGMALAFTGEDRFQSSLIHKMEETMAEFSWAFPAHVYCPSGKNPMTIDLFGSETANVMAELLAAFGDRIPKELKDSILRRLRAQYFDNYIHRCRDFFWADAPHNWNAVCHQGVLGAALTIEPDSVRLAKMLKLASVRLSLFLEGFCGDGSTSEGPSYWQYGFGRFAELNCQLEARTDGQLSLFDGDRRIREIARFAPACVLSGGHFVNFADGPRTGFLDPSLLFLLSDRLPGAGINVGQAMHWLKDVGLDIHAQRSDFFRLSRTFLRMPGVQSEEIAQEDVFFPDYGAVIARGRDAGGHLWEFAAKGGHNGEHHNHNDCGSYLLNLDGRPVIVEIGAPEYTAEYFGENRYEFLASRSLGHSVPLVNGCEQGTGAQFAAKVIECVIGNERVYFHVDLTACYPDVAGCQRLTRSFEFDRARGSLEVCDKGALGQGTLESMVISELEMTISGGTVRVGSQEEGVLILPTNSTRIRDIERLSYQTHEGAEQSIARLRLYSVDGQTISYRVASAASSETENPANRS